uniref:Uncharacterized protein n=1 Tax=Triticum urartu TaxID=4572 RepID=A0A8R7PHD7_TRIUA
MRNQTNDSRSDYYDDFLSLFIHSPSAREAGDGRDVAGGGAGVRGDRGREGHGEGVEPVVLHQRQRGVAEERRHRLRHGHLPLQVLRHLPHPGPRVRQRVRAHQPQLDRQPRLVGVVLAAQPRVHGVQPGAPPLVLLHPVQQHVLVVGRDAPQRAPPAGHLQHEHAEREHVRHRRRLARAHQLRRQVPHGAHHVRRLRVHAVVVQPRQPEVPQPAVHVGVQEHVAGLDVAVDHDLVPVLVEVQQSYTSRSSPCRRQ